MAASVSAQANRAPCTTANVANGLINNIASCAAYFSCVNGIAHSFTCPAGYYFDPIRQVCDVPANVACNLCPPVIMPSTNSNMILFRVSIFRLELLNSATQGLALTTFSACMESLMPWPADAEPVSMEKTAHWPTKLNA